MPRGSDLRLYRRAAFGQLAELIVLDTRQYRTDQPNDDRGSPLNDAAMSTANSMLGRRQKNWLYQKLLASTATWNVLAQQVMMGMVGFQRESEPLRYSMDQWPGYSAERMELMRFLADRRVPNPVVLTGDIHSNWVNELRVDDRSPGLDRIATEFVTTSISSGGNGQDKPDGLDRLLADNPCVKFHNRERGYVRCTVTPEAWRADYMVVDDVLNPGGNVFVRASFVVEANDPSVKPA
jgi:alkaline phosphatase D